MADTKAKKARKAKLSGKEEREIVEAVDLRTVLDGMRWLGTGFLDLVMDESGEAWATPPALKSPNSHVARDLREEQEEARGMARSHNERGDEAGCVGIEVVDNLFGPDAPAEGFPDRTGDPTLFRLKFGDAEKVFSVGSGRAAGAAIAGIRLASSWMADDGEINEAALERRLVGTALPDGRAVVFEDVFDGGGAECGIAVAFARGLDQRCFIEGFEAAAELFGTAAGQGEAA